ncbi:hypothetical protein SKM57_07105 [Acinetobacter faecalis]|nr:hypothetical protein [Acinetobacter faecalis]MDY6457539.1 hypothetical protein [Acinetobacter faecalis]MDY6468347.1 hypothetical protein [Acinetobacter faecalis]
MSSPCPNSCPIIYAAYGAKALVAAAISALATLALLSSKASLVILPTA